MPAPAEELGCAVLAVAGVGVPGVFLLALTKMVDNGALLIGRLWGRHKLAPKISPAKTVEGIWGGLCAGMLTAVFLGPYCTKGGMGFYLIFGLTIGIVAIIGDLAESLIKRRAGVKDSGCVFPGIGGVLDLMDSVLLSAPVGYFLFQLQ
jgi:phosphatidate cytidylyltransferase